LPLFEDRGTPELRRKRAQLVGHPDNRLASSPLGVLLARRLIQAREYHAGRHYAWLFACGVRRVNMPFLERPIGPGYTWAITNHSAVRARPELLEARAALDVAGAAVRRAVEDLVIYEQAPGTVLQLSLIRRGLETLCLHFEECATRREFHASRE
jgi:hypothetical protein